MSQEPLDSRAVNLSRSLLLQRLCYCLDREVVSLVTVSCVLFTELFERFAFYGVRGSLVLFLNEELGYSEREAVSSYSYFMATCYLFPLLGGYVADVWLGRFYSIVVAACFYAAGISLLVSAAEIPSPAVSIIALGLVALGTGCIKPSIATFGAEQLGACDADKRTAFFFSFYFFASVGTVLSYFCIPVARHSKGYTAAFGLSLGAIICALLIFVRGYYLYEKMRPPGVSAYRLFGSVLRACCRSRNAPHVYHHVHLSGAAKAEELPGETRFAVRCVLPARGTVDDESLVAVASILNILPLLSMLPLYWAVYDAQGSVWTLQRKHMNLCVTSSVCLAPEQLNVINPILVIAFVPIFRLFVFPCFSAYLPAWCHPTPLRRMAVGMQLAALSFFCTWMIQLHIESVEATSVPLWYQLPQMVCLALAELLVSATGPEWAYSQAPRTQRGTVLALYLVMVAIGNMVTGALFDTLTELLSEAQVMLLMGGLVSFFGCFFAVIALHYTPLQDVFFNAAV
jgi:POT family proton-dependent oligopeptide transporter